MCSEAEKKEFGTHRTSTGGWKKELEGLMQQCGWPLEIIAVRWQGGRGQQNHEKQLQERTEIKSCLEACSRVKCHTEPKVAILQWGDSSL